MNEANASPRNHAPAGRPALKAQLLADLVRGARRMLVARGVRSAVPPHAPGSSPIHRLHEQTRSWLLSTPEGLIVGVSVGQARYVLRRGFKPVLRQLDKRLEFQLERFLPWLVGRGASEVEATREWACRLHSDFQVLKRKRPFERTRDEEDHWRELESTVDVYEYDRQRVSTGEQSGRVVSAGSTYRDVQWIGYADVERIPLELAPPEFAGYVPGEWFDAIVERELPSWQVITILHMQLVPEDAAVPEEEMVETLARSPGTRSL